MRQQGEIARIIEGALHERGYVVSSHDKDRDRVVVAENTENDTKTYIVVRPDDESPEK